MSNTWFECKVKYVKIDDSGKDKKVTEPYLVDAISFTEAESRIHTELEKMISGEFDVTSLSKSNIAEIHPSEAGDRWFKAKVTYTSVDEESGKEKNATSYMLVGANTVKEAYDHIEDSLSTWIVPFEVPSISESPILDVFPFERES